MPTVSPCSYVYFKRGPLLRFLNTKAPVLVFSRRVLKAGFGDFKGDLSVLMATQLFFSPHCTLVTVEQKNVAHHNDHFLYFPILPIAFENLNTV